jgi:hypothetical protein
MSGKSGNGKGNSKNPQSSEFEYPFDEKEVISLVCKYFCKGHKVADIQKVLKQNHGVIVSRERPYKLLAKATKRGLLKYEAPLDIELAHQLRDKHGWLDGVEVVHSVVFDHLAYQAAREIIRLLRWYKQGHKKRNEVHIGFAGGPSMRILAHHLADLMCRPENGLPDTIFLHALVSGFNPRDPTTDPNAFFTYFIRRPGLPVDVQFMGLRAPAVVRAKDYENMKNMVSIKEAYEARHEIDIYITSGAQWEDDHSLFKSYMTRSPAAIKKLEAAECVGDILWRPLGPRRPIEINTDIRTMTLVELGELPAIIGRECQVMLVLGSCGRCDHPKGKLLHAVLNQEEQLITHLVADSRTIMQALGT